MGYGLGVFLLALGLILALAVQDSISGIDITLIGWILAAGRGACPGAQRVQVNSPTHATTSRHHVRGRYADRQRAPRRQDPPPAV